MPKTNELISSADFVNLKATVKKEITRRSNSKSTGSMAAYNNASYEYTTPPAKGVQVAQEHINKITQLLDAVNGGKLTPEAGALIRAGTLDDAAVLAANLAKKSLTAAKSNTGCKASCSGLCATGCYSGCTGCSGGCSGSCTGCSGCSGCGGSCSTNCTGCSGSCSGSCGSGCSSSCTGGCDNTCDGSCDGDCDGSCGDYCEQACSGGCGGSCGGCSGGCGGDCYMGCSGGSLIG